MSPDSPLPYVVFWPSKFFGSSRVAQMDGIGQGLYALMLLREHQANGTGLPADPSRLCRLLSLTEEVWDVYAPDLLQFFQERDGRLFNETLESQMERDRQVVQTRSKAGKAGAKARWQTHCDRNGKRNADAMANGMAKTWPTSTSTSTSTSLGRDVSSSSEEEMSTEDPSTTRIRWTDHIQTWNRIAKAAGLRTIRVTPKKPLSEDRKRRLKARLAEYGPEFWGLVEAEIRQRKRWARDEGFPTFDQVLTASTCTKLLEGNYRERQHAPSVRPDKR